MLLRILAVWLWMIPWMIGTWPTPESHAYVPDAGHLLEAAAEQRKTPPAAVVRQTRMLLPPEKDGPVREYQETVYFRFPGVFRSEMETDEGRRIYLERNGTYRIADHQGVSKPLPEPMDLALRLLSNTEAAGMEKVLTEAGVDLSVSSLGLFNGRLGFVLGVRFPDESAPQVWFDRETLLPFRWLIFRPNTGGVPQRIEIRYFTWQKIDDLPYPQAMEGYWQERRISQIRVDGIEAGAEISDDRFSFQQLMEQYPSTASPEPGEAEIPSPAE
jgi:hypothetical protein